MKCTLLLIGGLSAVAIALAIGVVWWRVHEGNQLVDALNRIWEDKASNEELVGFLGSSNRNLLSNTLTALEHRRFAEGREPAARLLTHPDLYVWYCASLYLGSIGDQRSVPYLIRGLTHPASASRPRLVEYLKTLTGQDFGQDKSAWVTWWSAQHKGETFDFHCDSTRPSDPAN